MTILPGEDGPEDQELQGSVRAEVHHDIVKVVGVVVAVVGHHAGVVGAVLAVHSKEVHALETQGVDAALHVLLDLRPVQDRDVRLRWDQAFVVAGVELDEPFPVLALLRVLDGEGGVVGDPHVVQPGPVCAVRPVDRVELAVDLDFAAEAIMCGRLDVFHQ